MRLPMIPNAPRRRGNDKHRRRFRPTLLRLEDRVVLSPTVFTVTSVGDSPGDPYTATSGDLRYCVELANSISNPDGSLIQFEPSVFDVPRTIVLDIADNGGLAIESNVTIDGPGASLLTLTVSGAGPPPRYIEASVITVNATATISGLTIANGYAANGGAIYNDGTATLDDVTISGNSSAYAGGGVWNDGIATLTDCTISGNSAVIGGGIDNYGGGAILTNCTISGNSAGGGIANYGNATLTNCTISGNSACDIATEGNMTLNNTIVADSPNGQDIYWSFGGHNYNVSGHNNLIDGSASYSGGLINGVDGNIVGANAMLAPLGNYGGPTQTMALLPGSPAIDAGNTALIPTGTTTDQRGLPRVVDSSVDIGAFESSGFTLAVTAGNNQSTPVGTAFPNALAVTVTPKHAGDPVNGGAVTFTTPTSGASATLSPSGTATIASGVASVTATANAITGGPYGVTAAAAGATPVSLALTNVSRLVVSSLSDSDSPGLTSLREALADAATLGGNQTITFAPGLTGTISLGYSLTIYSNVIIDGPGASSLTISGGGPSSSFSAVLNLLR